MLDQVVALGGWLLGHYQELLAGVSALLGGAIAVALVVPGPEPERTLQKVVDVLAKISKK